MYKKFNKKYIVYGPYDFHLRYNTLLFHNHDCLIVGNSENYVFQDSVRSIDDLVFFLFYQKPVRTRRLKVGTHIVFFSIFQPEVVKLGNISPKTNSLRHRFLTSYRMGNGIQTDRQKKDFLLHFKYFSKHKQITQKKKRKKKY